jgi:hypothetical protein
MHMCMMLIKRNSIKLIAMIFCTKSDFPVYGNLSGYSTKGKQACPVCEDQTSSIWQNHCKKIMYMGHQRFLPPNHHYRRLKKFDRNTKLRRARKGFDSFSRVKNINTVLGKRTRTKKGDSWKKRSNFWDLSY